MTYPEHRIKNFSELQAKKQELMRYRQMRSTKQGQIRAFNRQKYLANQEIQTEQEELEKINAAIRTLEAEVKVLS